MAPLDAPPPPSLSPHSDSFPMSRCSERASCPAASERRRGAASSPIRWLAVPLALALMVLLVPGGAAAPVQKKPSSAGAAAGA
eukprot:CAMPEP_0180238254 /NCGR_PEP_ID=MMETSP0987-20121128/30821_1 /TAXON_ID=697907 /ORGANISM="non described non described, Strain CCMP2293" /LENGTH=82 /DNA_ID=CAMNT_0022204747 /DNA_START=32 /DNA_END=277 /DNA_ORIENTATION=+